MCGRSNVRCSIDTGHRPQLVQERRGPRAKHIVKLAYIVDLDGNLSLAPFVGMFALGSPAYRAPIRPRAR